MNSHDEDDKPALITPKRIAVVAVVILTLGAIGFFVFGKDSKPKRKSSTNVVNIMPVLPPPPPPPTPPPTPPPPQDEPPPDSKAPEFQAEEQPTEAEPPKAAEADAPAPLGTDIQGEGGPDFGLAKGGGGSMIGGTGKGSGAAGSKWGRYAGQVQAAIREAISNNRKTKSAQLSIKVRVWADSNGRVTKASLAGSSGDPALDSAVRDQVLAGLQLPVPPEGMPMPIVMRITASRPN